ncbi:MAG: hypothetical protein EBR82_56685 [Caulobacteraceae bacterium]|nr:hypothetical protein [Caulobacteraceae bacterium]
MQPARLAWEARGRPARGDRPARPGRAAAARSRGRAFRRVRRDPVRPGTSPTTRFTFTSAPRRAHGGARCSRRGAISPSRR